MRTNEEELDLFADLIEPFSEILADSAVSDVLKSGGKIVTAVKYAIKNHKESIIQILARIDGVPVEEYHITALSIPIKLIGLFNKPEMKDLFTSQVLTSGAVASGSATGNIEDGAI